MFIRTQPAGKTITSQPASATLVPSSGRQGRIQTILTNLTVGTDFYIHLGAGANDGTAGVGGTFTFILAAGEPAVVIDAWTGVISCDPAPTAGQINVAELMGSTYRGTT